MQANTTLDSNKIVATVERLGRRIEERFPASGLHDVALTLLGVANQTERESEAIDKPIYYLRFISAVLLVIIGCCCVRVYGYCLKIFFTTTIH